MPARALTACFAAVVIALAALPARAEPPPEPVTVDAGPRLGGGYRIGDSPSFPITGRAGPMIGLGVAVAPTPRYSIGLAYEHSAIGDEHGVGDLGDVALSRSLDA